MADGTAADAGEHRSSNVGSMQLAGEIIRVTRHYASRDEAIQAGKKPGHECNP